MLNFRFNAIINIESISINLSISFCPSPENKPFGGKICDFVKLFKINQRDAIIRPRKVAKIFWFQIGSGGSRKILLPGNGHRNVERARALKILIFL